MNTAIDELIDIFEKQLNDETYSVDMSVDAIGNKLIVGPGVVKNTFYSLDDVRKFNHFLVKNHIDITSKAVRYSSEVSAILGPLRGYITFDNLQVVDYMIRMERDAVCVVEFSNVTMFQHFQALLRSIYAGNDVDDMFSRFYHGTLACKHIDEHVFVELCVKSLEIELGKAVDRETYNKMFNFLHHLRAINRIMYI